MGDKIERVVKIDYRPGSAIYHLKLQAVTTVSLDFSCCSLLLTNYATKSYIRSSRNSRFVTDTQRSRRLKPHTKA